jgi:hypothetical protein
LSIGVARRPASAARNERYGDQRAPPARAAEGAGDAHDEDLEEIASLCRLSTVFNDIPEHLFVSFCRIIEVEGFDAGAVIYTEGSTIAEDSVSACTNLNSTAPVRTVLKIGGAFGRYAQQQGVILTETIRCAEHAYALRVDRRPHQELMQNAMGGFEGDGHGSRSSSSARSSLCPGCRSRRRSRGACSHRTRSS